MGSPAKPYDRADDGRATDRGREAHARREELEHDERESGDEEEERERRAEQRVSHLRAEPEAVEDDVLVRLATTVPALADHRGRRQMHLAGRGRDGRLVERHDGLPERRADPVGGAHPRRVLRRERVRREPGRTLRSTAPLGGEAGELGADLGRGTRVGLVEAERIGRTDVGTGRDDGDVRGLHQQRGAATRLRARRTDPRHDRHPRMTDGRDEARDGRVDRALRIELEHDHREVVVIRPRDRVEHELRVRRIDRTLDLHDEDAAATGRWIGAGAGREEDAGQRARDERDAGDQTRSEEKAAHKASRSMGTWSAGVRHVDRGLLRHVSGHDRRGQGWGRQDDGHRSARRWPPPARARAC